MIRQTKRIGLQLCAILVLVVGCTAWAADPTSPGIPTRLAGEIALVHLGAGLDFLGLGLDQVPPQVLEEILEKYPRMKFKSQFRDLLVEHCQRNPAAQVLTWTDDVARTAGCTLHGKAIPTASQIMSAAPFDE